MASLGGQGFDWSRLFPFLDNPIYRLDAGGVRQSVRLWWRRRLRGGKRSGIRLSRVIAWRALAMSPLLAAAPYLAGLAWRVADRRMGTYDPVLTAENSSGIAGACVLMMALIFAFDPILPASNRLAGERARRTLDALVLTRMTGAEIVLAKAAALLVPLYAGASLAFLVWLAAPPLPPDGAWGFVRLALPPRLLLLCLWLDVLALAAACTFFSLAVSAWSRWAQWVAPAAITAVPAVGAMSVYMGVGVGAVIPLFAGATLTVLGIRTHLVLWAASAIISLPAFVAAQAGINPVPTPVRLTPWGVRLPLSRRLVAAAAGPAIAGLAVAGGLVVWHTVQRGERDRAYLSPTGPLFRAAGLSRSGKPREALAILDGELKDETSPLWRLWLFREKAEIHQGLREYYLAADAYRGMSESLGGTAFAVEADEDRGRCLERLGRTKEAIEAYRRAAAVAQRLIRDSKGRHGLTLCSHANVLDYARALARLGDRDTARHACEFVAREGDGDSVLSARQEIALLDAGLERSPRLPILFEDHSPWLVSSNTVGHPRSSTATIFVGDYLTTVDGRPMQGWIPLMRQLARHKPGDTVKVVVRRGASRVTVTATLEGP